MAKKFLHILTISTMFMSMLCFCARPGKSEILIVREDGGHHKPFTDRALMWLDSVSTTQGFSMTVIHNMNDVNAKYLNRFDAVIQLDFPPYTWPEAAQDAFIDYIENGLGGYIGFHHATLIGEFDGYPKWEWFSEFMGGISFSNYIAPLADGTVHLEDTGHPVLKDVAPVFTIKDDEWYTYDKNPRDNKNIRVLANVDENSYKPTSDVRMGDHPVIWTNTSVKARNVYFQFGHSPKLLDNDDFKKLLTNAINWVTEK